MSLNWEKDLAFGNKWQKKALEVMGLDSFRVMWGNFSYWDVICVKDNTITLREFKADRWASQTGNLAIECMHRGKRSGIYSTKADYWTYVVVHSEIADIYDIPVTVLEDMIRTNKWHEMKECGEDNLCYMFKLDVFRDYLIARVGH